MKIIITICVLLSTIGIAFVVVGGLHRFHFKNIEESDTTITQPIINQGQIEPADTTIEESEYASYAPNDDCKRIVDSLKTELFIQQYKVERVKYYTKICMRHPNQTKFLVSWIWRAIQ